MLRIGCVGYGTGGRHFNTPFIAAADGCELAAIVARAEATIAKARADWPDTPIFPSLTAMIEGVESFNDPIRAVLMLDKWFSGACDAGSMDQIECMCENAAFNAFCDKYYEAINAHATDETLLLQAVKRYE